MENGNGDNFVEQEPNGSDQQEQANGGSDDSQTKPLVPRSLFGSSAARLKEADLNSLVVTTEPADTMQEREGVVEEQLILDDAEMSVQLSDPEGDLEIVSIKTRSEVAVSEEDVPEAVDQREDAEQPEVVQEKEAEPMEVDQKIEESKTKRGRRVSKASGVKEPEKAAENTPKTEKRPPRRSSRKFEDAELSEEAASSSTRSLRARRSTNEPPVAQKTPASAKKQPTRRQKVEKAPKEENVKDSTDKEGENTDDDDSKEEEVKEKTPAVGGRSTRSKMMTKEPTEVTPASSKRSSRHRKVEAADNIGEDKTPSSSRSLRIRPSAVTPVENVPKSTKRQPGRRSKVETPVQSEKEETDSDEEESKESTPVRKAPASSSKKTPASSSKKTPASSSKKTPGSAAKKTPASAAKKTPASAAKKTPASSSRKRRHASENVLNLDPDDPFNFDFQSHNHPEPLTNIKVQKGSFGEVKFTRSPNSKDIESRYEKTEKAAARNLNPVVPKPNVPLIRPSSITALSTTPDIQRELEEASLPKTSGSRARGGRKRNSSDVFEPPTEKTPRKANRGVTPTRASRIEIKIEAPELDPEKQLEADFSNEPHPNGTRVYALWGSDFYPAVVFERDGLGRYKIVYTEDDATRDVPLTGIITLSKLEVGSEVAITATKDGEEVMQVVKIIRAPSKDDPHEWKEAVFDVEEVDSDNTGTVSYSWTKFFITKIQQKEIVGNIKNQSVVVDESNAVPRSARRSRLAASAVLSEPKATRTTSAKKSHKKSKTEGDMEISHISRKRGRNTDNEDTATPVKRRALQTGGAVDEKHKETEGKMKAESTDPNINARLFENCYFILTSSARRANAAQFNKREYKELVEKFFGAVVEDPSELELNENDKAFLVADGHYRTHKYLYALASSLPCLHFTWLNACVDNNKLVDYEPYLLKAGASVIDNEEYPWQPLKGQLFKDKTIFVYSASIEPGQNVVQFAEIWRPLLELLGANVITCDKSPEEVVEFCQEHTFDFMLTDRSCDTNVLAVIGEKGIPAVSSNWIIHSIIVNDLVPVTAHSSFSPQD